MVRCANVSQEVLGSLQAYEQILYIMHRRKDPLQMAEHSGDAAGIVPAVADVPCRATLYHL